MMFYLAKLTQLAGLTIIAADFLRTFPDVMNVRVLGAGVLLFAFGWIVQRFMLQK